jgi:hypothetical protein
MPNRSSISYTVAPDRQSAISCSNLFGAELPGEAGAVALDRRRLGCIEAGKLLAELFQCPDLVFYLRVRSP